MSTGPAAAGAPHAAPLSQTARIVNTFIAPRKTFADVQRNASWWAPWLVLSIVSLAFVFVMNREIGFEQISKNEIAHSSKADQFEKLPPDQQAKQLRVTTSLTKYLSYAIPITNLIIFAIVTAVLMGTFALAGARVPFGRAFAIVMYGALPSVIGALLGIISMIAGGMSGSLDKEAFNVRNPVATNPAYFMDPMGNKFLYGMVSALDIFVIWAIVLIGIGFSSNSKIKTSSAIAIVAGWYLLYKLIGSGLAATFS